MCGIAQAGIPLTSLNENRLTHWEPKVFVGETDYQIVDYLGRAALRALSVGSASGLVLKQRIDLTETPLLSWSWLIAKALPQLDERSKRGDDFAARVYVVIDGGLLLWRTKSLNYVWSSAQPRGAVWDNAFAGSNVQMIALRGKDAALGHWYNETRNVYQDLIEHFGDKGSESANRKSYRYIDVIAIMTDTDNSQSEAESYYGDIFLHPSHEFPAR
jgi:hypothetical protein